MTRPAYGFWLDSTAKTAPADSAPSAWAPGWPSAIPDISTRTGDHAKLTAAPRGATSPGGHPGRLQSPARPTQPLTPTLRTARQYRPYQPDTKIHLHRAAPKRITDLRTIPVCGSTTSASASSASADQSARRVLPPRWTRAAPARWGPPYQGACGLFTASAGSVALIIETL